MYEAYSNTKIDIKNKIFRCAVSTRYNDGKVGYAEGLFYQDGSMEYKEFVSPVSKDESYTERCSMAFASVEEALKFYEREQE